MLDLQSTRPVRFAQCLSGVRIVSAPVGQGSLTRRLSCIVAAGLGLISWVGGGSWRAGVVSGRSMEPGLKPGNVFLFQRHKPEPHSLHAGDVVLLRRGGETWIKRVYATAGARFWVMRQQSGGKRYSCPIRSGDEARFERIARYQRAQGANVQVLPFQVPHGKLFVVGDGSSSRDSREIGPISESEVIGKVVTALPSGLSAMPEWVELSFPTPSTFVSYGTSVPPNIQKRDAHRRALEARRAAIRTRSINTPGSAA